jgi:transposase-like protein/IS1 family transposase
MNPEQECCPNEECPDYGQSGQGNIGVHSLKDQRFKCKTCDKTFSITHVTAFYRLKKSHEVFTLVVTLLVYGCPVQAIVAAFGLDARTVAAWLQRAGDQSQRVHDQVVGQSQLDLGQVQADEIQVKTQRGKRWMALGMMVSTRLWIGGAVSPQRDTLLIAELVNQIRVIAQFRPLLLAVDGLTTYVTAFRQAFRFPAQTGKNNCWRLEPWPQVAIVQVVKSGWQATEFRIDRRIVQGTKPIVNALLKATQGGGTINTAYIERLNATFRQRLHCLARRSRALARRTETLVAGMYVVGTVYNFCTYHDSLLLQDASGTKCPRTPAMAAGLTDQRWTLHDLLTYKVFKRPATTVMKLPTKFQSYAVKELVA